MADIDQIKNALSCIAQMLVENEKMLCTLDSDIGDGDHGIGMAKVGTIIQHRCQSDESSLKNLLDDTGMDIMSMVGGSSGMLWGSFFTGLAVAAPVEENADIDIDTLRKMFQAGREELEEVSKAGIGDKTMMDAMIPAFDAVQTVCGTIPEVLRAAAEAAKEGAEKTKDYIAKFGRAKNLHERSLGFRDAGAVSASMVFEALASYAESV